MTGNRRGFVLLAVLWLIVALGAVATHAALRSRQRNRVAMNLVDETRARAAAEAGIEHARSRLQAALSDRAEELRAEEEKARAARQRSMPRDASAFDEGRQSSFQTSAMGGSRPGADPLGDPWRLPSQLVTVEDSVGDVRYTITTRDGGELLNINTANEEWIRNFLAQGLRVDAAEADRITQAILDWRDEDDNPRLNGGERDEYLRRRAAVLPSNGELADLAELQRVIGVTADIYERMLPYLTAFGTGTVNVNSAPEPVLLAIPGMTPAAAQQIVRQRRAGTYILNAAELSAMAPGIQRALSADSMAVSTGQRSIAFSTTDVDLLIEGRIDGSPIAVKERVIISHTVPGARVVLRRRE